MISENVTVLIIILLFQFHGYSVVKHVPLKMPMRVWAPFELRPQAMSSHHNVVGRWESVIDDPFDFLKDNWSEDFVLNQSQKFPFVVIHTYLHFRSIQ